ncbi:MAG: hypothetical protein IBX59_06585 [Yoonia sp.]|nr:hypothetical protein [Yoonia sp.]
MAKLSALSPPIVTVSGHAVSQVPVDKTVGESITHWLAAPLVTRQPN